MKIVLERHAYAPELNKAYIGPVGAMIRAKGAQSIADVRKSFKALPAFVSATVKTVYDNPDHKWLQRTYFGRVESREEALSFARDLRSKLVPGGRVEVTTKLLGY